MKLFTKKGQVTVELILLATVLLVLGQVIFKTLREGEYLKAFARGPTQVMGNMMANGNWKRDPGSSRDGASQSTPKDTTP